MWRLHQLSESLGVRPSDLVGVKGSYRRFCFDQAVVHFGQGLQIELESITGSNKSQTEMRRNTRIAQIFQLPDSQRFRSVRGMLASNNGGEG